MDGIGICAEGPVYSVGVVAAAPLEDLGEVLLTDASRSSRNLLKLIYAEFMPQATTQFGDLRLPEHSEKAWPEAIHEALTRCQQGNQGLLLIGDRALAAHRLVETGWDKQLRFYDLAELWGQFTGLPFVFAMWGLRTRLPESIARSVAGELRELAAHGLARRAEIAEAPPTTGALLGREQVFDYLTRSIRYDVGDREKQGLTEYLRLLKKHALLSREAGLPQFV